MVARGKMRRRNNLEIWIIMYILYILKTDQSGMTASCIALRDSSSMLCGSLDEGEFGERMDTYIFMAEIICCPPETITKLLTGYTPIENKKLKKIKVS